MAASVVAAIDQHVADAGGAQFAEGDFGGAGSLLSFNRCDPRLSRQEGSAREIHPHC
jgi:hypothetical protein